MRRQHAHDATRGYATVARDVKRRLLSANRARIQERKRACSRCKNCTTCKADHQRGPFLHRQHGNRSKETAAACFREVLVRVCHEFKFNSPVHRRGLGCVAVPHCPEEQCTCWHCKECGLSCAISPQRARGGVNGLPTCPSCRTSKPQRVETVRCVLFNPLATSACRTHRARDLLRR